MPQGDFNDPFSELRLVAHLWIIKTSTTYNTFMYLTLPVPTGRGSNKVSLNQCLDAFVKEEVMEKTEAWYCIYIFCYSSIPLMLFIFRHCPNCKALRKATKQLSLSRLPPVLLIHLKRFSFKGPFTDKIETFVDFPLVGLDLTNYMPPPLPPGIDKSQLNGGHPPSLQDPRTQMPPYKYDLYAVTNHFGSLSGGHCKYSVSFFVPICSFWLFLDTAFISTREGWAYCDDSSVKKTDFKEVVVSHLNDVVVFHLMFLQGRPAYILFYKRAKT
jgi:ubiquitin carboxyl-terminal hydrolase 8